MSKMEMGAIMQKFGGFIYQHRKLILILWIILIISFGFFTMKLPSVLSGFKYKGEYNETRKILEKDFGQAKSTIILVFQREETVSDEDWNKFIKDTFVDLNHFDGVQQITTPFEREGMIKKDYAYGILSFNKKAESLGKEIDQLKRKLKNKQGLKVTMTGKAIIVKDLNTASQEDLAKAEIIGLPIALLVLTLAFGGLVAASIPLVIGVISILTTMGTVYFFSYGTDLTIFILNIVPMIGLALSIDFALLFINRFEPLMTKVTRFLSTKTIRFLID
jgi:putative drug exporter of the RND superfamily